jgi:flagellin
MGLRIGTNLAALAASRYIRTSQIQTEKALMQLASGNRFSAPGEDPAGYAISEHLRGQVKGLRASRMNADNAISFVQVAEGGLNEQNNLLIRMRELAIQAASDTVSDVERSFIEEEFQGLKNEVDRIAKTTQYGSTKLLTGTGKNFEFQVGPYRGPENTINFALNSNTTSEALEISALRVGDQDDSMETIEAIDLALDKMGHARSSFGAIQGRLQSVVNHLANQEYNIEEARSKIADTNVAEAVTQMTLGKIRGEVQAAVLAQANQTPQVALKLIS